MSISLPTPAPPPTAAPPPSPRLMGRPSRYSPEMRERLCDAVRTRGLSDSAAAGELDIPRPTLSRWKKQHPELRAGLAAARAQFFAAKHALAMARPAPEESSDWRTAARDLRRAFPNEYGSAAERLTAERKRLARLARTTALDGGAGR